MPTVDTIDFKTGESKPTENGQSEKVEEQKEEVTTETEESQEQVTEETQEQTQESDETQSNDEDISSLPQWAQDKLKKVDEEKENYKKGMLKYKDLSLKKKEEKKEEETVEEEYPDWDEDSKKFQKQTLGEAEKLAEKKARAIIEESNEKSAIAKFIQDNPELSKESKWNEIIANYAPTHGKNTVDDVLMDLNRALVLHRYESGELDNMSKEAEAKGELRGKAEAQVLDKATVSDSDTTSKTVKGKINLSEGALALAKAMRVDPEKLAEEDDSSTATVNF